MNGNLDNQNSLDIDNRKFIRKRFIISMLLVVAIMGTIGVTLALSGAKEFTVNTGTYNVTITGSTSISATGLVPITNTSNTISYNNLSNYSDSIFVSNFKVIGVQSNPTDRDIIYDIALIDSDIDGNLLNEYLKWELIKNGEIVTYGNFSDLNNGERYLMTDIQQDLPRYNQSEDSWQLVIFINNDFPNGFDQSTMMNKSFNATIDIELYTMSKIEYAEYAEKAFVNKIKRATEQYIAQNGASLSLSSEILFGDVNLDGGLTNIDATRLYQYLSGWDVSESNLKVFFSSDVIVDKIICNDDADVLFQKLTGWSGEFPRVDDGVETNYTVNYNDSAFTLSSMVSGGFLTSDDLVNPKTNVVCDSDLAVSVYKDSFGNYYYETDLGSCYDGIVTNSDFVVIPETE